jgi:hypothetical protein
MPAYDCSMNSVASQVSIVDNILHEYEHVCVMEEYAERAKCTYCLETANTRNIQGASRRYCQRFSINDCSCHMQPVAISHKCRICCEIEDDIRFLGDEIMRGYLSYAQDVVHSFRTNPDVERRMAEMAFRREMLHEFLIHQKIRMERRETNPEENDDLFSYVSSSDSGKTADEPEMESFDEEYSYMPEYDRVPELNDGGPMKLSDLSCLSLIHPDDITDEIPEYTRASITHHIPCAPMKLHEEEAPTPDDPMDISYTP